MNTRRIISFVLLAALLMMMVASAAASALRDLRGLRRIEDSHDLGGLSTDLSWNVLGAGGGHATSASYSLDATLGQPFVGPSSSTAARLSAGFWQDVGYRVYLPVVLK